MWEEKLIKRARRLGLSGPAGGYLEGKVNEQIHAQAIAHGLDADNMSMRELHAWFDSTERRQAPVQAPARPGDLAAALREQNVLLRKLEGQRAADEMVAMNRRAVGAAEDRVKRLSTDPDVMRMRLGFEEMARAMSCTVQQLLATEPNHGEKRDIEQMAARLGCSKEDLFAALGMPASGGMSATEPTRAEATRADLDRAIALNEPVSFGLNRFGQQVATLRDGREVVITRQRS